MYVARELKKPLEDMCIIGSKVCYKVSFQYAFTANQLLALLVALNTISIVIYSVIVVLDILITYPTGRFILKCSKP